MAEREGLGVKKLLKEFETFIMRGNVIDMAVGVIVGAAFQAIVNSLVNDVISPLLGLVANMDLSYLVLKINDVEIRYGAFVTAVIDFPAGKSDQQNIGAGFQKEKGGGTRKAQNKNLSLLQKRDTG